MKKYLFLSCQPQYRLFAEVLVSALKKRGVRIWSGFDSSMDELLIKEYRKEVAHHIAHSSAILAIIAKKSDTHVIRECESAPAKEKIIVVCPEKSNLINHGIFRKSPVYDLSEWGLGLAGSEFTLLLRELEEYRDKEICVEHSGLRETGENVTLDISNVLRIRSIARSVRSDAQHIRDDLVQRRPNSPDGILQNKEIVSFIERVINDIENIDRSLERERSIQSAEGIAEQIVNRALVDNLSMDLRKWFTSNRADLVDIVIRMTPATGYLALLSLAGANMNWATPIVLAVFGGKSVAAILSEVRNSDKG